MAMEREREKESLNVSLYRPIGVKRSQGDGPTESGFHDRDHDLSLNSDIYFYLFLASRGRTREQPKGTEGSVESERFKATVER